MNRSFRAILLSGVALLAVAGTAAAQSADPPGRIGRLAYLEGSVSYHDAQQDSWSKAALNAPLTTGDSLWTEPSGHDEIAIAGTRVRMDGDTQLDMLALDDTQTRLQLDQGRLDIKAIQLDQGQPYQVVTPRGTVTIQQAGDYYIHAGSADDPTVLGVRSGAAQIQTPNGLTVSVRAGEVAQVTGDGATLKSQTVQTAPPAMPAYWAQRDQQISYAPPQYLSADVTGYEDMAYYGAWRSDPEYGEVWTPNNVSADWQPYSNGYWAYSDPYGWNWVGSEPWGFAPYHYGRWAQRENHWFWVPPDRRERPVYAPALVAFVGGVELGMALGGAHQPVGWFPLGPREAYVPPYARDRVYYERLNASAHVPNEALSDRWQRAERHEAIMANQQNEQMMNRRFMRVVSAEDFAHSRPVQQVALKIDPAKLANAPVAPVAAPPAPNRPIAAAGQPAGPAGAAPNRPQAQQANALPARETRFGNMEEIARPQNLAHPAAPGPKIVNRASAPNGQPGSQATGGQHNALPPLVPHAGAPAPRIEGAQPQQNAQHPGQLPPVPQANREEPNRAQPNAAPPTRPGEANRPAEANRPGEANRAEPPRQDAQHPNAPTAQAPQHQESPRPAEARPTEARPAENRVTPAQPQHQAAEPQHPAPQAAQPQHAEPQRSEPQVRPEPPRQQAAPAPQPAAQPPHTEVARPAPQQAAPAPQMQHAAPPPQAHTEAPRPAPQQAAPPQAAPHPQQAQAPAPQAHPAPAPQQAPHPAPQQEHHEEKK